VTYVITDACIGTKDRSCVDVCPVDCIHPTASEEDNDEMLYIDPNECIDCGACEPACPVSAIFAEDDVPDNLKGYTEVNSLWYSDKEGARAKVAELHG
jgi:NAD-dependent dihydropyrimidine dehydrogenase PreA subunit